MSQQLELYAVRNADGHWFHRKGYQGTGDTWVEDFSAARIYTKVGPARGVVSFFANNYPDFPTPELVKLVVTQTVVIDETARVKSQQVKKANRQAKQDLQRQQHQVEQAKKNLADAQAKYDALNKPAVV